MSDRFVSLPVVRDNEDVREFFFNPRHVIRIWPAPGNPDRSWMTTTPEVGDALSVWNINLRAHRVVELLEQDRSEP